MNKSKEMLCGLMLSVLLILLYDQKKIDAKNLALGKDTFSVSENWKGQTYTAYWPTHIKNLVDEMAASSSARKEKSSNWLWLGNSQLHAINQLKEGDHLAPYWARVAMPCPDCVVPMGLSVANANLQEYLLISRYVEQRLRVKGVIIELSFIGLREDGIRGELSILVDKGVTEDLSESQAGEDVLKSVRISENEGEALGTGQNVGKKDDSFQGNLENSLETAMGRFFPIWEERNQLKSTFLVDMYFFKNWLFNIKPNTVRKLIQPRYERNMRALEDILRRSKKEGVPVILYVAPIRQDMQLPYEPEEYALWKRQVEKLAGNYNARFLNLEKQVPVEYWGTYLGGNVDFMHFQGPGHQIVGQYIAKYLTQ